MNNVKNLLLSVATLLVIPLHALDKIPIKKLIINQIYSLSYDASEQAVMVSNSQVPEISYKINKDGFYWPEKDGW